MISYIRAHWRGQHALMRALGLNTVAVNIGAVFVLSELTLWVENNRLASDNSILTLLILFWTTMLCWQTVGSFRSATRRVESYGSVSNYYVVLAIILTNIIFALGSVATQYGGTIDYTQRAVDAYKPANPTFQLVINQSKQLVFTGDIGHGATAKLTKLVNESPESTVLILNSDGGLIAEARGLANVIKQYGLNTSVTDHCYSACTIVYIAGTERSLAADGSLGFHQYYVDSKSPLPWIEPVLEQAKDLSYFQEKNVAKWFMDKAYGTPHSAIWTPSVDVLLAAGVITKLPQTAGDGTL